MDKLTLDVLQKLLTEDQFDSFIEEPSGGYPFECLKVFLGNDSEQRERFLEIILKDQYLTENPVFEGETRHTAVQFYVSLPFQVRNHSAAETGRFLAFINRSSDFPGFEMDEIEGEINFRYLHMVDKNQWDTQILRGIIGVIIMYLNVFLSDIEKVAKGVTTTPELLEHYLELANVSK